MVCFLLVIPCKDNSILISNFAGIHFTFTRVALCYRVHLVPLPALFLRSTHVPVNIWSISCYCFRVLCASTSFYQYTLLAMGSHSCLHIIHCHRHLCAHPLGLNERLCGICTRERRCWVMGYVNGWMARVLSSLAAPRLHAHQQPWEFR